MSATENIDCDADGVSWTPGSRTGYGPKGPVTWNSTTPIGIIDFRHFLQRVFLGMYTNLSWDRHRNTPRPESLNCTVEAGQCLTTTGMVPLSDAPVLKSGFRKRSNPQKLPASKQPINEDHCPVGESVLAEISNSLAVLSESDDNQISLAQEQRATISSTKLKLLDLQAKYASEDGEELPLSHDPISVTTFSGSDPITRTFWGENLVEMQVAPTPTSTPTLAVRSVSAYAQSSKELAYKGIIQDVPIPLSDLPRRNASSENFPSWLREEPMRRIDRRKGMKFLQTLRRTRW